MVAGHAGIGDEPDYKIGGVGPKEFYIFQAPAAYTVNGVAIIFPGPFNAKEVYIRLGLCLTHKECPLARAYLNMDGPRTSENIRKTNRLGQILRVESNLGIIFQTSGHALKTLKASLNRSWCVAD
jgi:hypothetical protein